MKKVATLSLTVILGIAFMVVPSIASNCGGNSGAKVENKASSCGERLTTTKADNKTDQNNGLVLATFSVQGMTCGGCEMQVGNKLKECEGVTEVVEVSHKDKKAVVKYDPNKTKAEKLASTITKLGYIAEVQPAVAKATKDVVESNDIVKSKDM